VRLEWVWGLLQPGFVRWAPPLASQKTTLTTDYLPNWRLCFCLCVFVRGRKSVLRIFHWGRGAKGRRTRAAVGFLGTGQQYVNKYVNVEVWEELWARSGVRGGAPTDQSFPTIFRTASPDAIILLIVDYHAAAVGGKDPRATLAYGTPLRGRDNSKSCRQIFRWNF